MIENLPDSFFIEKARQIQQAMFYCYDNDSNKIPVGLITSCQFTGTNTIVFSVSYFPVIDIQWNIFPAEIHFYKKEFPFSLILHGNAGFSNTQPGEINFTLQRADYFEKAGISQQSLPEKVHELFSNTGEFIKKVISQGI